MIGRKQAVINELGDRSSFLSISSGVPQGSSPGPILFAAVINSIHNYLKFYKFSFHLFADDLQLFVQCPPAFLNNAIAHINEDSLGIIKWATEHGLKINANKTKAIVFGSDINLKWIRNKNWDNITVNDEVMQLADKIKNLGVYMTSALRWNAHISYVSSKIHNVLYKLRARAWIFPKDIKTMLVSSLVLPHIDYACLLYNDIPAYLNLKVQRLMNAGIRFIFNLKRDSEITLYREELGWVTVEKRRLLFLGILTFKILHSSTPAYLYEPLITQFIDVRRSNRIGNATINIKNSRTESYKQWFNVSSMRLWLSLDDDIRSCSSLSNFRSRLLNHLSNLS